MPTAHRARDLLTAGLATLALLTLVAGVPVGLVTVIGWPLPTAVPDAGAVGNALRYGTIAPETLLKAMASLVWVTWAALTTCIAIEAVAVVRGTVARALPAIGGLQHLAARLVTATMLLSTLSARPSVAAPLPSAPVNTGDVVAAVAPASVEPALSAAGPAPTWTVRRHESLWTIAERALGDGQRWREIHDLNTGRPQPDGGSLARGDLLIQPGWVLRLPGDARIDRGEPPVAGGRTDDGRTDDGGTDAEDRGGRTGGSGRTDSNGRTDGDVVDVEVARHGTPSERAGRGPRQGADHLVEVQRGDHLWGLAERHLGRGTRWRDIYRRNAGRPQPGGRGLEDPDVILPGWVLELPGRRGATARPADHDARPADHDPPERDHATERVAPDGEHDAARGGGPPPVAPLPVTPSTLAPEHLRAPGHPRMPDADRQGRPWGATAGGRATPGGPAMPAPPLVPTSARHDGDGRRAAAHDAVPVTGIALLATGLVGVLARRRRHWLRQRRAGTKLAPIDPETAELERWLRAVADHDLSHRAERVLRVLPDHFDLHGVSPTVEAIEFGEAVRLRLARPEPTTPPGITASPDGRTWTLDPELEVAAPVDDDGPLLTPALLCCGHRPSGDIVTIDPLAIGVLDVAGPDEHVQAAVTAWTAELAAATPAALEVVVVGPHHDLLEQFATVTIADDAAVALDRVDRALAVSGHAVVLSALPAQGEAWDVLRRRAREDPHVAVIAPGQAGAAVRVDVDGDEVRLLPDGGTLARPEWLTPERWDRYDDLLRQPVRRQQSDLVPSDLVPSPLLRAPADVDLTPEDGPARMVRVLGPLELDGLAATGPRSGDLLAFLAVHRGPSPVARIADGLAWSPDDTVACLSAAQAALGADDGGAALLVGDGDRYHLSEAVACDVERLHALAHGLGRLAPAAQAQRLRAALALVRGVPFRDVGGWAHAEGTATAVTALVSDLAHRLATIAMTFGDLDRAAWAIAQGLLASPGCELLVRDRMRVADARGDHAALEAAMRDARRAAEAEQGWVTPETVQLYERLTHASRSAAAPGDARHAS